MADDLEATGGDRPQSYEHARDELAEVVKRLEAGGLALEESLRLWERGERLALVCEQWLEGAKERATGTYAEQLDTLFNQELRDALREREVIQDAFGRTDAAETALRVAAMLEGMAGTAAIRETGPLPRRRLETALTRFLCAALMALLAVTSAGPIR